MADFLEVGIDSSGALRGAQTFERAAASIQSAASRLDREVSQLRSKFDAFAGGAARFGAALTASLTLPLAALAKQALDSARSFDSLTRGMTAVSGSAENAKREIAALREVAKLPGLGFKEAIQGSINLQAAGLSAELARRSLAAFGNALATVGKGKAELDGVNLALSQIVSKGKISAEEINQIAERVPQIRKITEAAFGTSNTEVLQKRGIGSTEFINKIVAELEKLPKVTGGVQNAFENLSDTIEQALVPVGNALLRFIIPAIEAITPAIEKASAAFASLSPTTQSLIVVGATIVAALGPALLLLGAFAASISSIVGVLASFGVTVAGVGAALTGVGAVLAVAAAAAAALYIAWQTNFGGIREITADVSTFIQERFGAVVSWFEENWPLIKKAAEAVLRELKPLFEFYSNNIKAVWAGVWEPMKEIVRTWGTFVGGTVRAALAILAGDFDKARLAMQKTSEALWNGVKNVFALGVAGIVTTTKGLFSSLLGLAGVSKATGQVLGSAIMAGIKTAVQAQAPAVYFLIERLVTFANGQIARIKGATAAAATTGGTGDGPSALFERSAAEAANAELQLKRAAATPSARALGGGGGGSARAKELTDLQKAQQELIRLEKDLLNLSDARIQRVQAETFAIKEKIKAAEQYYENERKLSDLSQFIPSIPVPGGVELPAILSSDAQLRDAQIDTQKRLLGIAEALSKVQGQLLVLNVPDALSRELPEALREVNDALRDQVEAAQQALSAYDQIKNGLNSIIDAANGVTAGQKLLRRIGELPADFDPTKRAELEKLAEEALRLEEATARGKQKLTELQQAFRDFGQAAENILADAFYQGIVEGPRAFFQTLLQGFAQLLAQMAAQLLASQVFKLLGNLGGSGGGGGGGFLGILGTIIGFAGSFAGSFGANASIANTGGTFGNVTALGLGQTLGRGFASGGTVTQSGFYRYGELGPEPVFMPNGTAYLPQGAYVQNNHQMRESAQAAAPPVVNINVYAQDAKSFASPQTRDQIARDYQLSIARANRNGGHSL